MFKLILLLILLFFLADDSDARNLGLKCIILDLGRMKLMIGQHHGKNRQKGNNVGQCYMALGFQRKLLSTRQTLRMILGNKEEAEKKSEQAERGT